MERAFKEKLRKNYSLREMIIFAIFTLYLVNGIIVTTPISVQKWFAVINEIAYWITLTIFLLDTVISLISKQIKITTLSVIFVILGVLSWIFCGSSIFLFIAGMCSVFERYGYMRMLKKGLKILEICFVCIIIASFFEIVPNWDYPRSETVVRYSLGFVYPTVVSSRFLYLIMLNMCFRKTDISYLELGLYAVIGFLIYRLTDSRTGFYLIVLTLIIWLVCKIFKNVRLDKWLDNKIVKSCVVSLPVLLAVLSIVSAIMYNADSSVWTKINSWLSDRLRLSNDAITKYGVNLMGQDIDWYGWGGFGHIEISKDFVYNYVDNAYLKQLFDRGIVGLVMIVGVYTLCLHKTMKEKNYWFVAVLIVILVQAVIDDFFLDVNAGNFFVLAVASYLIKPGVEKTENDEFKQREKFIKFIR